MRKILKDQEVDLDPHFRYIGKNQTRVEALSDAAFALVITLSVAMALVFRGIALGLSISGFIYMLYPVLLPIYDRVSKRRRILLLEKIQKLS
ncbi:MAG: hypothetical protein JXR03_01410 [Cyclobacteriaceae bacterium]